MKREPFAIVPESVLSRSARAVKVYGFLALRADGEGRSRPGRAYLAARCGCSENTIDRALLELRRAGVIQRVNGHAHEGEAAEWIVVERASRVGRSGSESAPQGDLRAPHGWGAIQKFDPEERARARETRAPRSREEVPMTVTPDPALLPALRQRAQELGEKRDLWLRNVGRHYSHDEEAFREEYERAFGEAAYAGTSYPVVLELARAYEKAAA